MLENVEMKTNHVDFVGTGSGTKRNNALRII